MHLAIDNPAHWAITISAAIQIGAIAVVLILEHIKRRNRK